MLIEVVGRDRWVWVVVLLGLTGSFIHSLVTVDCGVGKWKEWVVGYLVRPDTALSLSWRCKDQG